MNANPKKNSDVHLREAAIQLAVMGIQLQNFDPYARPVKAAGAKSKMNVQISGTNYLTDGFKKRYQDILAKGESAFAKAPLVEEIETVTQRQQTCLKSLRKITSETKFSFYGREGIGSNPSGYSAFD